MYFVLRNEIQIPDSGAWILRARRRTSRAVLSLSHARRSGGARPCQVGFTSMTNLGLMPFVCSWDDDQRRLSTLTVYGPSMQHT